VKKNVSVSLKFPRQAQFALVGVAALCVLMLGWMVVLAPKQRTLSDLHKQTQSVQQQIADDLSRASDERSASTTPTIKVADVYKLQTAMPSITDMPDLLLELDAVARAAGVTVVSLQPDQPSASPLGTYSTVAITLSANANFYSLTDFLYRLRNLVYVRDGTLQANGRIFSVTSVNITPQDAVLKADISLTTYVYGSVAPTSAALPTATDTTDTSTDSSSEPPTSGATP